MQARNCRTSRRRSPVERKRSLLDTPSFASWGRRGERLRLPVRRRMSDSGTSAPARVSSSSSGMRRRSSTCQPWTRTSSRTRRSSCWRPLKSRLSKPARARSANPAIRCFRLFAWESCARRATKVSRSSSRCRRRASRLGGPPRPSRRARSRPPGRGRPSGGAQLVHHRSAARAGPTGRRVARRRGPGPELPPRPRRH